MGDEFSTNSLMNLSLNLPTKSTWTPLLDPDGQNVKEEAFQAFCEIPVGRTILDEDVKVEAQKCDNIHCYEHNMTYSAPLTQIVELIESSGNCSQSISVECISAPYQVSIASISTHFRKTTISLFNFQSLTILLCYKVDSNLQSN